MEHSFLPSLTHLFINILLNANIQVTALWFIGCELTLKTAARILLILYRVHQLEAKLVSKTYESGDFE